MVGRVTAAVLIVFNVSLGVLVIYLLSKGYQSPGAAVGDRPSLEYKDLISILLMALGLMIALARPFGHCCSDMGIRFYSQGD
jgi:hypothetical protein